MSEIIKIENVKKTFITGTVETHALRGIDLSVETGEFLALVGPSGSGKTTLLNLIGTLDEPTEGKIFIDGQDISTFDQTALADLRLNKLGFIFQAYNLIPVLTAYENVEFVLLLKGIEPEIRKQKVETILKELGLEAQMHKKPNEMSGGQQQRVAVARAIVSEPKLILADEPTANLDSKTSLELLEKMRELNEKYKVTFIFSTHDPMVMEFARRIVHIRDGKIEVAPQKD